MKSILEELFYGNVCPNTDCRSGGKEAKALMGYIADHHDALLKELTEKQKERLEKLNDCRTQCHNHRPCRWLALAPLGHVTRLSLKARRKVCQPRDFYRHAPKGAFLFAPFYWLTRERVNKLFYAQLIIFIILLQLIPYVLLDCLFIASYCIYIVSSTPEMSIPIFIL